jgi:hypothetical protein
MVPIAYVEDDDFDDAWEDEDDVYDFELRSCGGIFCPGTEQCDWCIDYDLCANIERMPIDESGEE